MSFSSTLYRTTQVLKAVCHAELLLQHQVNRSSEDIFVYLAQTMVSKQLTDMACDWHCCSAVLVLGQVVYLVAHVCAG